MRQCICQRRRDGKQATTESNTGTRIRRRRQTTEAESLIAEARLFVQTVPDSTSFLEKSQENQLLLSSSEAKLKPDLFAVALFFSHKLSLIFDRIKNFQENENKFNSIMQKERVNPLRDK